MKKSTLLAACILNSLETLAQVTVSIPYCPSPIPEPGSGGSGIGGGGIGGNETTPISTTPGVTPVINGPTGPRYFLGYYPIPSSGPILDGESLTPGQSRLAERSVDGPLTQEKCAEFCADSPYFAITYGTTCTCGSTVPAGDPIASPDRSTACPGNPTESCGAPGYGIVYGPRNGEIIGSSTAIPSSTVISSSAVGLPTSYSNQTTSFVTDASGSTVAIASSSSGASSSSNPASSVPASSSSSSAAVSSGVAASSSSSSAGAASSSAVTSTKGSSTTSEPSSSSAAASSSKPTSTAAVSSTKPASSSVPASTAKSSTTSAAQAPTTTKASITAVSSASVSVSPYPDFSTYGPLATPAACPADNKKLRTDPFSTPYGVDCGKNLAGNKLKELHADSSDICLQACDLRKTCAGVSYLGGDINEANQKLANCQPYAAVKGYVVDSTAFLVVGVASDGVNNATDYQNDVCTTQQNTNNQDVYTDIVGNQYDLTCGHTLTITTNLQATAQDSLSGCLTYCSILDGCQGAIFSGTGPPSDPTATNCQAFSAYQDSSDTTKAGFAYGTISI